MSAIGDFLGSDSFIGAGFGLGALTSLGSSIYNGIMSYKNFDYQKELQREIFNREDTALQRKMKDAEAAGLNPYSVINQGGANSGSVVSTKSPELNMNGTLDSLNALLTAKQNIEITRQKELETANLQKQGQYLDGQIIGQGFQNRMLNLNLDDAGIANFLNKLNMQREVENFNYDFNRNISDVSKYGNSDFYGFSEIAYPYNYDSISNGFKWNKWYDRNIRVQDYQNMILNNQMSQMDLNNYGDILMLRNMQAMTAQESYNLAKKENDSYYFNRGVDIVSGLINTVLNGLNIYNNGLVSRFNANTNRFNSETNRINATTNRIRAMSGRN